jgi:hypothetical protein
LGYLVRQVHDEALAGTCYGARQARYFFARIGVGDEFTLDPEKNAWSIGSNNAQQSPVEFDACITSASIVSSAAPARRSFGAVTGPASAA